MAQSSNEKSSDKDSGFTWKKAIGGGVVAGGVGGLTNWGLNQLSSAGGAAAAPIANPGLGDPLPGNPDIGGVDATPVKDFFGKVGDGINEGLGKFGDYMHNLFTGQTTIDNAILIAAVALLIVAAVYCYKKSKAKNENDDNAPENNQALGLTT